MTPNEQAAIWKKVSDRMEAHANNVSLSQPEQKQMAGFSLFAWEISQAYTMHQHRLDFPAAHAAE